MAVFGQARNDCGLVLDPRSAFCHMASRLLERRLGRLRRIDLHIVFF